MRGLEGAVGAPREGSTRGRSGPKARVRSTLKSYVGRGYEHTDIAPTRKNWSKGRFFEIENYIIDTEREAPK